ncbi:MAG: hypothetical protein JST26_00990 [Bacteroidetes bacterium]|nr:hypothetical protein [Bacteroidota bacterium]
MIRSLIIALCVILTGQGLYAQNARETKLLDKMCSEACAEIEKQDYSKKDKLSDIEVKLGMALLPSFSNNKDEIKSVWGLDVNNPDDAKKVGEKLGAVMVYKCPKFQKLAFQLAGDDKFREQIMEKDETPATPPAGTESVAGNIEKIEGTDVNFVFVKNDDGETMRLMWLDKCPGSELLESYLGGKKNIRCRIEYRITSVYQAKTKAYQPVKVITNIIEL